MPPRQCAICGAMIYEKFFDENGAGCVLHCPVPLYLQKCRSHLGQSYHIKI
jgi:hypothetical protein